ncbi:MAG: SMP-30/gluconolactonase/LRE family protein [Bacteroidales bacterium]|nr:SMP-30/gluconolactonase/LRE family protein [Bacteroidales bacterium]
MKLIKILLTWLLLFSVGILAAQTGKVKSESVYTQKPNDTEAFYFTPENFNIKADGKMDVSDALQTAINKVKTEKNFGILFIPEGKYLISKTIYIPGSIRLIGYGKIRPEIILAKNSPGYQVQDTESRYPEKYMIFFTGGMVTEGRQPGDAGAGTFYSAISNIDLRIEDGNPFAVAMRTHYAQHGFVSHMVINVGKGKAGISEVGNEMENVKFYGGDYGIICGQPSPSWPMMTIDTYFEGQRKAAIQCHSTGFAIVHMHVKNVPVAVEIRENDIDRLYMENCLFDNVTEAGVIISREENALSQVNLLNIDCRNVPVIVKFRQSGKKIESSLKTYKVKEFTYGLVMGDMATNSEFRTISKIEPLQQFPLKLERDIPALPPMETWVNIKDLGAKGDGETDDTKIFQDAVANYSNIYVPQGWYRFTATLKMKPGTKLIGLHPMATQFILKESEPAFSGFGGPKSLLESSEGGDDILNGIGLCTGGYNYRAVACKWMAGQKSLMNDVKFVGGHGTMRRPVPRQQTDQPVTPQTQAQQERISQQPGSQAPGAGRQQTGGFSFGMGQRTVSSPTNPVAEQGKDLAWDNQYWSLWVTNNGGGTLKDIWTANTYATTGLYVSNTSTPSRIYAMSLEHHVRNEARFENVSNWKIYAFQLEEESREGKECQMVDLSNCKNIRFGNLWIYRVIRVTTPKRFGVRIWNCENIEFRNVKNYTQKLVVTEFTVYDVNKNLPVYPWEYAKLTVSGKEPGYLTISNQPGKVERLVSGFDFITGITSDSKGNIYFCETLKKRIYKWSAETNSATMIADYPLQPFVLATDTKDNLLIVFRYDPQPGYMVGGKQETVKRLPDDNPGYSSFGNSGWAAYAVSLDPGNPDETFKPMPRVATSGIKNIRKAFYPSSRWHYTFDRAAVYYPDSAFLAPDGITIIPETYDIGRCAALSAAVPGQPFFASDEIQKRLVQMDVAANGKLSNLKEIHPRGEYSTALDKDGNLYVADGQIFVYDKNGKEINRINVEERPISITFGGKDGNTLFITTNSSLYSFKVK